MSFIMEIITERDKILNEIYTYLMEKGEKTSKQDVLDSDSKVYTKKIPVDINVDKVKIKFISVTGYSENLSDTSKSDIRICINNYNKDFLNLFVVSVGDDTLKKILNYLKENV